MSEPQRDVQPLIERMRKLADQRHSDIGVNECPPEAECDDCDTVRALREAAGALDAARALVTKLDAVHGNQSWQGAMVTAYLHGHRYDGPTYNEELHALRCVLGVAAPDPQKAGV